MPNKSNKSLGLLGGINKLRELITGTKDDNFEDDIFKSYNNVKNSSAPYNISTFKDLMNATLQHENKEDKTDNDLLQEIINETLTNRSQDDVNRVQKYKDCNAIKRKIGYAKRAHKCIKDNILNADYFNNEVFSFDFNEKDTNEAVLSQKYKKILDHNNKEVLTKIKIAIGKSLELGDYFIEIINSKDFVNSFSKNLKKNRIDNDVLLEDHNFKLTSDDNQSFERNIQIQMEGFSQLHNTMLMEDDDILSEEILHDNKNEIKRKVQENNLDTTIFKTHDPKTVLKLGGDDINLGYVVFTADYDLMSHRRFGLSKLNFDKNSLMDTTNSVFQKISSKLQKMIQDKSFVNNNEDLLNTITNFILQYPSSLKKINLRYVPENRMVHFKNITEDGECDTFGRSIFEDQIFNGKLLIALKTSLTINRISNSMEKDIIYFEMGLNRDAKSIIESFKQNMKQKKISIDKLGNVDSIPSMIPNYQTFYVPQKDGQKFIEFDKMQNSNTTYQIEDIRMIRDEFVASLGVPSQLIGLEENASIWQNTLSEQNLFFARTVINYQTMFQIQVKELLDKIFILSNMSDSDSEYGMMESIKIKFHEPKQLKMRLQSDYIQTVLNMVDQMSQYLDIDRKVLTKKLLKDMLDNNDIGLLELIDNIEKINKDNTQDNTQNMSGYGGGF